MTNLSRKLPIGIQTFEEIRKEGYLYVDKTRFVWEIANTGKPYFLSRPRRFGKSLLLSTLKSYFSGRKDLFEGLTIEQLETQWIEYPVLHLDLNAEMYDSVERLHGILNRHLVFWEEKWGKGVGETSPSDRFNGVIRRASEATGKGVVVLIDEYDKPLLQTLLDEELNTQYRKVLKSFYGVLKSADENLRFAFLTGITKFAQVSVFSDLNQLQDISLWPDYANLCGITLQELVDTFEPELNILGTANQLSLPETVEKMTKLYDGYHFLPYSDGLFNPFSVLSALKSKTFGYHWFATGTPTYLVDLLKESDYDLRLLMDGVEVDIDGFVEYRAESSNPIPMIYQSGYLTIKAYNNEFNLYTLGFPNDEVRYGFLKFLVPFYTKVPRNESGFLITHFVQELRAGDVTSFIERLKAFFAGIPYELSDETERHYQVIFYLVFRLMGQFVETEVRSARGRADAVVITKSQIYVFEFKLNGTAEEALQQIDDKGYMEPYVTDAREKIKVGVEFNKEKRNIERFIVSR